MFKHYHISYKEVSVEEFNNHLEETKYWKTYKCEYEKFEELNTTTQRYTRFLSVKRLYATLSYKLNGKKWVNIKTNISKDYTDFESTVCNDPVRAYAIFARVVKPKEYRENVSNIGPYQLYPNIKTAIKYDYAICYDINKSYFNAMNNPMPTEMVAKYRCPNKGEVGFTISGHIVIGPSEFECDYIFKLERIGGLDRYREIYLNKLNNAKTKEEKKHYKFEINSSVGNLANHNPFLRNMIVWYANNFIKSKVDENTIYSNTDSIVSTVKRDDLEIGSNVGQFKIEHEGPVIIKGSAYQWINDNKFSNKGVSLDQIALYEKTYNKKFILGEAKPEELANLTLWRFNYEKEKFEKIVNI